METEINQNSCPVCHQRILPEYYFCPNCGNNLREKAKEITIATQVGLYMLAIFLPPLGLWPGIKYLNKEDIKAKKIGGITTALTLFSTVVTIWWTFKLVGNYLDMVNGMMLY